MYTVIETPTFQQQSKAIWTDSVRDEFFDWIARNPLAGDVIPQAQGARKVRWAASGRGKRGGARIIYFHLSEDGALLLIAIYTKSEQSNMKTSAIKKVR
ncbi:MAG: hypothetical protein RLZZ495_115 [Pseudomonadota bacterium]|jgi:mRNA-degrading endonuclease RelE of RelBE toxin-antitoxin system